MYRLAKRLEISLRPGRALGACLFNVVSRQFQRHFQESMTLQFTVPSMACASCAAAITRAVQEVDPQATVQGDPATKQVIVETQSAEGTIREAIEAAGFPVG